MPTENPKLSAYVPQIVYDCFKQFQQERSLSMSQAIIELLVDYFDIDLSSSTQRSTNSLRGKISDLESQILELNKIYNNLSEKIDQIYSTSSSPKIDSEVVSELKSELLIEDTQDFSLLIEIDSSSGAEGESESRLPIEVNSSPDSKLPFSTPSSSSLQLNLIDSPSSSISSSESPQSSLKSELPSDILAFIDDIDVSVRPLKTSDLALRFEVSDAMIHKVKRKQAPQQIEYTRSKDPKKKPWIYSASVKLFYPLKV